MKQLTVFIFLLVQTVSVFAQRTVSHDNICTICERVNRFDELVARTSESFWPGFNHPDYKVPLFYFTQRYTYMFFAPPKLLKRFDGEKVECTNGLKLYKVKRIDSIAFHMSNQADIEDEFSPYYRNPVMFCSDVAAAKQQVPDITNTEEWAAIVLHEYFHGFQLNHSMMMDYLADNPKMGTDTLAQLYRQNEWFKTAVGEENELLLQAIQAGSANDAKTLALTYLEKRKSRRDRFKAEKGYDPGKTEDFWEKLEGTARYVEYNLAYVYMGSTVARRSCDSSFNNYATYKKPGFENMAWMHDKTTIMPAYVYVTGFNLCRLMDKLKIPYKEGLFDRTTSLAVILERAIHQ